MFRSARRSCTGSSLRLASWSRSPFAQKWPPSPVSTTASTVGSVASLLSFFFQAEDGIRDYKVTGVQTCALPISFPSPAAKLLPVADVPVLSSIAPRSFFEEFDGLRRTSRGSQTLSVLASHPLCNVDRKSVV